MFSVVARLGVASGRRDAGTPVGMGVEGGRVGFAAGVAGVGEGLVVFWFLVE